MENKTITAQRMLILCSITSTIFARICQTRIVKGMATLLVLIWGLYFLGSWVTPASRQSIITSPSAGMLTYLAHDNTRVGSKKPIAIVYSPIDYKTITEIRAQLKQIQPLLSAEDFRNRLGDLPPLAFECNKDSELGYLTPAYNRFAKDWKALKNALSILPYQNHMDTLMNERAAILDQNRWKKDYPRFANDIMKNNLRLSAINQELGELSVRQTRDIHRLASAIELHYQQLVTQLNSWEQNYVITAPKAGTLVYYHRNLAKPVKKGDILANIITDKTRQTAGLAHTPALAVR